MKLPLIAAATLCLSLGACTDIDLAQWLRGGYVVPGGDDVVDSEGEDQDFPH